MTRARTFTAAAFLWIALAITGLIALWSAGERKAKPSTTAGQSSPASTTVVFETSAATAAKRNDEIFNWAASEVAIVPEVFLAITEAIGNDRPVVDETIRNPPTGLTYRLRIARDDATAIVVVELVKRR